MKKNFLLCSMLLTSFVAFAEDEVVEASEENSSAVSEEFNKQQFTWTYSVKSNSSEMSDFAKFNGQLRDMITQINRGENSNMYQQMLNFMKELQEAIVAGYNLFGSVMTSKEPFVEIAEQAVEAITEEISTSEESSDVTTKDFSDASEVVVSQEEEIVATEDASVEVARTEVEASVVDPVLSITLTCAVVDEAGLEAWNLATTMLQDLADSMNNGSITPDEVVESLASIYDVLTKMSNAGLSLTSASL